MPFLLILWRICTSALIVLSLSKVGFSEVFENLDNCSAKEKHLALDALGIKPVVTRDRVKVQGVIPMDLVTIEQTSA